METDVYGDNAPATDGRTGDAHVPNGHGVSRRMLIAGGGIVLGAVAVGWGVGGIVTGALDAAPGSATRRGAGARPASHVRRAEEITARSARGVSHRRTPVTPGGVPGQPVYRIDDGPKVIALTIDDGPSPVYTPQVLRLLAKYRVTAAFSMIGENASHYPGVARDVADAGHMIVNHTWDHANLTRLTSSQVRVEIAHASDAIEAAVGAPPAMFRAPYGAWSPATLQCCASAGLTPLDWSVDPRDWSRPGVSAIVGNIMRYTRTGSIILEHDGGGDRSQTVAALAIVIPSLLDEGYRFQVPLPADARR